MTMREYVTVRNVGNSTVITIPATIKTAMPLEAGDRVLLTADEDRIVVTRELQTGTKPHKGGFKRKKV